MFHWWGNATRNCCFVPMGLKCDCTNSDADQNSLTTKDVSVLFPTVRLFNNQSKAEVHSKLFPAVRLFRICARTSSPAHWIIQCMLSYRVSLTAGSTSPSFAILVLRWPVLGRVVAPLSYLGMTQANSSPCWLLNFLPW